MIKIARLHSADCRVLEDLVRILAACLQPRLYCAFRIHSKPGQQHCSYPTPQANIFPFMDSVYQYVQLAHLNGLGYMTDSIMIDILPL